MPPVWCWMRDSKSLGALPNWILALLPRSNGCRSSPGAGQSAGVFVSALNTAMSHYQIVSLKRVAVFIAKIGHWFGQLLYVRERGSDL